MAWGSPNRMTTMRATWPSSSRVTNSSAPAGRRASLACPSAADAARMTHRPAVSGTSARGSRAHKTRWAPAAVSGYDRRAEVEDPHGSELSPSSVDALRVHTLGPDVTLSSRFTIPQEASSPPPSSPSSSPAARRLPPQLLRDDLQSQDRNAWATARLPVRLPCGFTATCRPSAHRGGVDLGMPLSGGRHLPVLNLRIAGSAAPYEVRVPARQANPR